jgi:hypothetical protein
MFGLDGAVNAVGPVTAARAAAIDSSRKRASTGRSLHLAYRFSLVGIVVICHSRSKKKVELL